MKIFQTIKELFDFFKKMPIKHAKQVIIYDAVALTDKAFIKKFLPSYEGEEFMAVELIVKRDFFLKLKEVENISDTLHPRLAIVALSSKSSVVSYYE